METGRGAGRPAGKHIGCGRTPAGLSRCSEGGAGVRIRQRTPLGRHLRVTGGTLRLLSAGGQLRTTSSAQALELPGVAQHRFSRRDKPSRSYNIRPSWRDYLNSSVRRAPRVSRKLAREAAPRHATQDWVVGHDAGTTR